MVTLTSEMDSSNCYCARADYGFFAMQISRVPEYEYINNVVTAYQRNVSSKLAALTLNITGAETINQKISCNLV